MYKLSEDTVLTAEHVVRYIDNNLATYTALNKLYDYYKTEHDILDRTMTDSTKPNNKLVNPYGNYITDMMCGYFMGVPVTYNSDIDELADKIQDIFNQNDEQAENAELAKYASIYGKTYEYMYLDCDANICFLPLDTREIIPIYKNTLKRELLYVIRYYDSEDIVTGATTTQVEVYDKDNISYYTKSDKGLSFIESIPHIFGQVPIIEYLNNTEELGDFEPVISLIDAYDKMESDSLNDFDLFADAYLALVGMSGTDSDDIATMKENRILLLDENGAAEWLIKQTNDEHIENMKNRLEKDIHTFSKCPKLTDENFAGTASGISLKYKLMGLENATAKKERAFKKGLQKRLSLITNILNIKGGNYDYRDIDITFTRNLPVNLLETAQLINNLSGTLSEETLIAQVPFITDVQQELERKKNEVSIEPYGIGDE